jgi:guanylate kinase
MNKLIVIVGVSAVGKSSLLNALKSLIKVQHVQSLTTRPERIDDVMDRVRNVSFEDFNECEAREELVSVKTIYGNKYGYLKHQDFGSDEIAVALWRSAGDGDTLSGFLGETFYVFLEADKDVIVERLCGRDSNPSQIRLQDIERQGELFKEHKHLINLKIDLTSTSSDSAALSLCNYLSASGFIEPKNLKGDA